MSKDFLHFRINFLILGFILLFVSCEQPEEGEVNEIQVDLSEYQVAEGYKIEPVAAEPQVVAPVNIIFDEKGRIWVIEMVGYMTDFAGTKEDLPNGRISILEDRNGNGVIDHVKVFLDSLVMPRAIAFVNGGLLYAEPPALWWTPIQKGDVPGDPLLVDSAYAVGGNVEHQPNGLVYNIDNWIYNSEGHARYRYRNRKWEKEYIFSRGQWGLTQDEYGHLYFNDNSNQFRGDYFLPGLLDQNRNLATPPGVGPNIVADQSVYPLQFTSVNRGYMKGVLDSVTQKLRNFTSASGPLFYTGDQYDEEFDNNSFVAGPEANLIKRNKINTGGVVITGEQYYKNSEFIISPDEAFRPVILRQGPDGWIYIVDMHRGIIQHKTYMTNYLREKYDIAGLDTVVDMGRILRILPEKESSGAIPAMVDQDTDLISLLKHPNQWQRLYAQQRIVDHQMKSLISQLKELVKNQDAENYTVIHAFWTLEGLDALNEKLVLDFAVMKDGYFLPHAIKYLSIHQPDLFSDLDNILKNRKLHLSEKNRIYWAAATRYVSDKTDEQVDFFSSILYNVSVENRKYVLYMALSQFQDKEDALLEPLNNALYGDKNFLPILKEVEVKIEANKAYFARNNRTRVSRNTGLAIFESNCSTCHGRDGRGNQGVAPPLYKSEYLQNRDSALIMIVLHGLQGPVTVDGKYYEFPGVMPSLADNKQYSDQEIAAVLSFIKNAFGKPKSVSARLVKDLREYPSKDGEPYSVESLEDRLKEIGPDGLLRRKPEG